METPESSTTNSNTPPPEVTPEVTPTKSPDQNDISTKDEENNASSQIKYTGVKDYGVSSDQNAKFRRRMEDAHYCEDGFNGVPEQAFFGVYDGHGGNMAANFCAENLHKVLSSELNKEGKEVLNDPPKVLEILKQSYLKTDEKMKGLVPTHHGCTVVTCVLTGSVAAGNRQLFTANAGDGRAVLCRNGQAIRLTEDHKATSEVEAKRITDAGGFIINGRVNGQIVITRSLGDHLMKDFIIGTPHVDHQTLTDQDTHIIVACDGLWDVVEDQQAVDLLLEFKDASANELSKRLLVKALQDGSTDNLSIVVIKL
jgi:protein phosphatase PTC1